MAITFYDKSAKYGDLHQGFAVVTKLAAICKGIDLRNPATVKFARLILGNHEAVRDSIDDIASYARKSGGDLTFVFDENILPANTDIVLETIRWYVQEVPVSVSPTMLAYVCAIFAATSRGDTDTAFKYQAEYCNYIRSTCEVLDATDVIASVTVGVARIYNSIANANKNNEELASDDNQKA